MQDGLSTGIRETGHVDNDPRAAGQTVIAVRDRTQLPPTSGTGSGRFGYLIHAYCALEVELDGSYQPA